MFSGELPNQHYLIGAWKGKDEQIGPARPPPEPVRGPESCRPSFLGSLSFPPLQIIQMPCVESS
jgi:hypothetical protein